MLSRLPLKSTLSLSSSPLIVSPLICRRRRRYSSSVGSLLRPSSPIKSLLRRPAELVVACRASSVGAGSSVSMDSPPPPPEASAASVESVTRDLKNQSLDGDGDSNRAGRFRLEDLNWDHSFVRDLPGDPRTDAFPREVSKILSLSLFSYSFPIMCWKMDRLMGN